MRRILDQIRRACSGDKAWTGRLSEIMTVCDAVRFNPSEINDLAFALVLHLGLHLGLTDAQDGSSLIQGIQPVRTK